MNAPACGTCGRPMPPAQQGAPGGAPAKTMFGYAAPVVPQANRPGGQAPAPAQAPRPGAPGPQPGFPQQQPPQANPYGAPQQPQANPYGAPQQPAPPANPYGQPQPQANPYGAPQQPAPPANPYGAPQQPQANPYGAPQQPAPPANPYGAPQQPPQANPYGAPQQPAPPANPYGAPQPQANPYGAPQQPAPPANPYGAPQPQANPYGAPQQPPQANPYGAPQANPYGAPAGGGYPQAQQGFGAPQQDLPGPLDDLARKMPSSAPGTIFGFPVSALRDPGLQKKILLMAGIALVASIVIPYNLSPMIFAWSFPDKFAALIWPIIAGGAYLLLTAAPADMRAKVPPMVLQWIPFGVAYAGVFISQMGFGGFGGGLGGIGGLYILGYSTLVFGLLARIAQPQDQTARIIIAVGAGCLIPSFLDYLSVAFKFGGFPILLVIHNLLWFVVLVIGVFCIVFVVPPKKLPPALQAVDALGPLFAAILIGWLPLQQVLIALAALIHGHAGVGAILFLAHGLLPIVAYFGVLMMAAPNAYEEAMRMFKKGGSPPQGGGYPPQGGGYPPQGGGYPPQGGGYPPQGGGGYPPQGGGGYPPQGGGGGYPPQGGGGWQ